MIVYFFFPGQQSGPSATSLTTCEDRSLEARSCAKQVTTNKTRLCFKPPFPIIIIIIISTCQQWKSANF